MRWWRWWWWWWWWWWRWRWRWRRKAYRHQNLVDRRRLEPHLGRRAIPPHPARDILELLAPHPPEVLEQRAHVRVDHHLLRLGELRNPTLRRALRRPQLLVAAEGISRELAPPPLARRPRRRGRDVAEARARAQLVLDRLRQRRRLRGGREGGVRTCVAARAARAPPPPPPPRVPPPRAQGRRAQCRGARACSGPKRLPRIHAAAASFAFWSSAARDFSKLSATFAVSSGVSANFSSSETPMSSSAVPPAPAVAP